VDYLKVLSQNSHGGFWEIYGVSLFSLAEILFDGDVN